MPLSRLVMFSNKFNYSIDYVLGLSKVNTIYDGDIILDKKEIGISLITTLSLYTLCKTYKLSIDEFLRLK